MLKINEVRVAPMKQMLQHSSLWLKSVPILDTIGSKEINDLQFCYF